MKTLTEGIFKNVINTSVLEPEGHHSENFQARSAALTSALGVL